MKERKDQNEKIKELTEQLHEGITNLFESERYRDYLQAMAKFHNYSFNNSLLIWAQRPDASAVAGYRAWQTKFQRTVNPGAKGIMIIEPAPWKRTIHEKVFDEDGNSVKDQEGNELTQEVERTYQGFKVGYRKKTGEFFLYGYGNARTKYAAVTIGGMYSPDEKIIPLSEEEAKNWMEQYGNVDTYIELFGEVDE